MYITPGPPEVYKIKNGSMATLISNGPSGQENAILSINHDNPCTYFEISIWLNRFGLTCIGGGSFEAAEKPQPSLQKALGVVWHAMGSALCVIANGDVSFIKISWINKSANAPILYSEAASIYDSGAGSPPVPNSGDQIAVKLLRKIRHSVEATAICQGDNGRYLLISSKRGLIYKFSWLGLKISEISTDIHHEVFRSWELGSLFSFMKAQCHVYGSKSNESSLSYLATPVLESVEEANRPERKVSNTYLLAEDSSASDSERIISCGYCSALQIHYFVREDGSLSFLQDLESNSEAAVKPRTNFSLGYRGTGQIHLFTLMKPDAAVTDQKNLRRPSIGANGTNSYGAENLPYGGCQPAVSKVTHVCVIQGETAAEYSSIPGADISEDDSALFVLTVLTCHLPSHEPYGECDRYKSHSQHLTGSARSSSTNGNGNGISKVEQRATLSLISVRVRVTAHCNAEQEQTDVLKMEQVSSVILEVSSGSVNSSQSSAANDGPGVSSCCALSGRSHSLVTLHRFGQVSQLVLVTVRGVISCRPVGSLTSELFRIDSNSYSSGVRHTISSVTSSLGRLLIAVTRQSDSQDAISAECWSQVHVIPLLESAESSVFHGPCGDVLVDGAEQRLLAFKMLWNQDPGSVGPGGPGYFSELSVPEGLTQEWAARVRYLSLQSARGKSVSGGVLLIASSVLESSGTEKERSTPSDGAVRGVGSASASAGKGYLAVVVAGRSALRSDPCLWVFNALTRRWRSCDITKGKFEGEGDKVSSSSAAVDRSSMEMGSGLWIDVDLKAANGTHLSGDMLLNRQYSTDSEISNSSRLEYRRATSITQLPSSSMNSPSSSSPVSHPSATQTTSTVLGIAWFGDHSLILLRRAVTTPTSVGSPRVNTSPSQSVFTLEVLSRAPTKESMRSGRPRPAAHRVLPLSLAVPSSFSSGSSQCDFSPRLFEVRHSGHGRKEGSRDGDRVAEWCTVVLCNGWYCIGYSVEMIHSAGSEGVAPDYRVSVMWDICLSDHGLEESESPMKTLYGERNGDSTRAQMSLPVSAISILSPAAGEGPCLLMLDANGAAWRVRSFNCDFISKGPFSSMSTVDRTSLFQSDSKEKASAVQSDETSPQSASSQGSESIVLLHGCHSLNRFGSRICGSGNGSSGSSGTSAISGDYLWMTISENDENSAREGESPFLLIPLEGTHTSATATSRPTPLSMTVGILKGSLITLHRALECLPLSSASSSSSGAMRDLLLTEASGVAVSRISLGYNIFLALLEILSGRKSRSGVPSANASAHVALDGSRTVLVSVMRRFLWTLQDPRHSPVTLRFFVECVELRIKHLLESSTFLSPKKSNRWVRLNSPFGPSNSSNIRTDTFVSGRERYCEIMSALYYCSPPSSSIFCELISRLGRKLEPSLSRRLFPVPLDPRLFAIATHSPLISHSHRGTPSFTSPSAEAMLPSQGADTVTAEVLSSSSLFRPSDLSLAQQSAPSPGPSPLIVFEHALSTRQLSRSCRLLTLACEDVGGTDSPASASLCLRMVLELLYECLRHLSMPLAVQCFDFCRRLEVMIGSMDMDGSSGLLGSGSNHGISASSDQSQQGVRMGEPQTVPSALSRGQRRIESSPELQVACGGNAIWLGVGGGVFSSLTSVSPALSYYIGGTMIWAVAQTIRLLSDAPAATPATSSSSSSASQSDSSHSRGNTDARSTYVYTVLPALTVDAGTVSRTSSSSPSPSMALLSVLLKDVLSNGRFHCCAALMASLLAASSSSAFKDLLRARLLVLYLSQGDECPGVTGTEEESALAATRMAMAVASAFKLSRLVSMKSREREKERESHALSAKLSQTLLPPYMRVKCEREMAVREQAYSTLNNEGRDICSTLVASDIISIVLSDAQTYRSSSRVVFHSAAEITAQAIRQQDSLSLSMDDTDIVQQRVRSVSTLLTTLSANPSPFPSPTLKDRAQPPARVLPDAVHAVCNIDTGGLMNGHTHDMSAPSKNSADESGAASNPTVRVMLCSVCVAMLLTGDADGAGAVAALLLDRPDIKAVCSVLSHSNSRSNSNFSTNATASVPVPVPDSSPSSGAAVDSAEVERALEPVEEQEQEQRRGAAEERSSDGVAAAVHSALSFFFGASGA